ncbi:TIR-NBS-LRR resistance protein [Trifolium pratense]|uniref:TIR-NBS-LRR resistance protein n=1 Tax=Trifolium pratense TaxID=57577 RepID=A0A2K3LMG0_TRIPR|nr:TIR-NBS-LRR resistance protein [Trifolium pratense]
MHDLIQDIGREIVRAESIRNPGQHSRLWDPEEIYDVLTNNRGTSAVEGILLDMDQTACINLTSKAFKEMPNLRLLAFRDLKGIGSVYLPMGLDLLPKNLRYLEWNRFPLKSLPSTFCPEMLAELSLRHSNVEKLWNGVLNLPNLEILDLRGSIHLIECPNLSSAPNIKNVDFIGCERLPHVDPSIFSLEKLEYLNVSGCTSLKSLSGITCSPSLKGFSAWDCINLQ